MRRTWEENGILIDCIKIMERFEQVPLAEKQEIPEKYHFKEIADIESAMISLVGQLKDKIDQEDYDTLISDDGGGRIPTIVLRSVIKERHPDQDLGTFFVASGKGYSPASSEIERYKKLQSYLSKITKHTHKALLVTQFISSGKTVMNMIEAIKDAGVDDIDIATAGAMPHFEKEDALMQKLGGNHLYVGNRDWHMLDESHDHLGGVGKSKDYSPIPKRKVDLIAEEGRKISQEEWASIFEIEKGDAPWVISEKSKNPDAMNALKERLREPLTAEEKENIQNNIMLAREDAKLLVKRIVQEVWSMR